MTKEQAMELLGEALDFIREECVENYPGARLPNSFAEAAHDLCAKITKALIEDQAP